MAADPALPRIQGKWDTSLRGFGFLDVGFIKPDML